MKVPKWHTMYFVGVCLKERLAAELSSDKQNQCTVWERYSKIRYFHTFYKKTQMFFSSLGLTSNKSKVSLL